MNSNCFRRLNLDQILDVIDRVRYCTLALVNQDNTPYINPMMYNYSFDCDELLILMVCNVDDPVVDMINANPNIEVQFIEDITRGSNFAYKTVNTKGIGSFITDEEEKKETYEWVLERNKENYDYIENCMDQSGICMLKVTVNLAEGKVFMF